MKVAFRVDASVQIGTGHLVRCLTLADALRARGALTRFICRAPSPPIALQIRAKGHELVTLPAGEAPVSQERPLAHAAWLGASQAQDAAETLERLRDQGSWDLMVVDHYGIDQRWQTAMREAAALIFVIDDLADRQHDCDLLLDQNLQPDSHPQYASRVPSNCRLLLGPAFALLRPEFTQSRRPKAPAGQRLNIFLGGTDPQGGTLLALEAIAGMAGLSADIVVGASNPHLDAIRARCAAMPAVTLHVQAENMAELFSQADLGLGAGGSASLERCCCGLPSLLTSFAENQRPSCEAFAQRGAAINLGPLDALTPDLLRNQISALFADPARLADMSQKAAVLVDGRGVERVMDAIASARTTGGKGLV